MSSSLSRAGTSSRWLPRAHLIGVLLCILVSPACAGPDVIPPELEDRVDLHIPFVQLKKDPASFQGKLVLAGGVVLSGRLLKDGTRIEILQLPLESSYEPGMNPSMSQGRFLAFQMGFLDPATLPTGTRVTVLGEVTGAATLPLDETEYTYLTLAIKKLTVWPRMMPGDWFRPYPYFGAYWGTYWGPYWSPPPGFSERGAGLIE